MSILITGGTGWIGRRLVRELRQPVKVVTRNAAWAAKKMSLPASSFIECDLSKETIAAPLLTDVSAVINLMGDSIAEGRWTKSKKRRIRTSRSVATSHLVHSLISADQVPDVFVSASAIGIYGDQGDTIIDESSRKGTGFLPSVCNEWEQAASPLINFDTRVCFMRIGIVLGKGGGALAKMIPPFKFGLGGKLGSGQQWMSWIHMEDLVNQIVFLLKDENASGPYNATSPEAVINAVFTKSLGNALGRPTWIPVPSLALKIGLGEFAEYLLASQRVAPQAFVDAGFEYLYPDLASALRQAVA